MTATVTAKLNKPAREFQAGESTGFGFRLGEKVYNRETKENEWVNYDVAVFTRTPNQIEFYRSALIEGSIVQVHAKNLLPKTFDGQNGTSIDLKMIDADITFINSPNSGQQPAQPQQFQQQPQQQWGGQPQPQQGFQQQPQQPAQPQQFQQQPQQGFANAQSDWDQGRGF